MHTVKPPPDHPAIVHAEILAQVEHLGDRFARAKVTVLLLRALLTHVGDADAVVECFALLADYARFAEAVSEHLKRQTAKAVVAGAGPS